MKHSRKLMFGLAVRTILVGVWAAPAAGAPWEPEQEGYPHRGKYVYERALLRVDVQHDRSKHALAAADLVEEYLADEEAAGYDTSVMETALSELRGKLTEALGHNEAARQILEERAGFDDEGYVTDPQQARETMRNAHRAMREVGESLRDGCRDFRHTFREYRRNRRSQ